jgi:ribosomal protein L11 methyltransferase
VLAELTVLAPGGVEESSGEGFVEFAIYGAEGELPDIGELEAVTAEGAVSVTSTEVADDWADRWREFHRPVEVSSTRSERTVWVGPPWSDRPVDGLSVVIDPGRAFGTGAHPTTRLCLAFMLDLADRDLAAGRLTDIGSGSGVLAIAAAGMGWSPVEGFDTEPAAVEAARLNAVDNGVEASFERRDFREPGPALAETVVANLTAPLLIELADHLDPDKIPLRMVCSGLLDLEGEKVTAAFDRLGLRTVATGVMDGWRGLLMESSAR